MDGLLIDSEPLWTVAEIELAGSLGGIWSDDLKAAIVGTRLDVAIPRILEWYDVAREPADVTAAMDFLLARMVELFRRELPLMAGAIELIDGVRALGVPTALVSSSYRVLVDAALDTLGRERFDTTLAGDEVGHGKPSPEPYLTACATLGVSPAAVVILEDAMSGVTSGEAAGATVVAVPWAAPIEARRGRPVVASLTEIDPHWLVEELIGSLPPRTRCGEVADVHHGESVRDPYRWLEDTDSTETAAWVVAQNQATADYLGSWPNRGGIRDRLAELWESTRWGTPHEYGGRWFFTRHDPGADQPVLRVAATPDGESQVLLDPNELSADGTVALTSWEVSADGTRLCFATSAAGSDWMTWRVVDVDTGAILDDVVKWSKWSGAAWLPDASGFFYGALDAPTPGKEFLDTNDGLRVQLHFLGTSPAVDEVVYADPDPKWEPDVSSLDHDRWLVITVRRGTNLENVVLIADLHDRSAGLRPLLPTPDARARVVGNDDTTFFVLTNDDAPRQRLVAIDLATPGREHWREVIPQGDDQLQDVTKAGDRLIAHVLHDASSALQIWTTEGERVGRVTLPPYVTVTEVVAGDRSAAHIGLTSFTDPASVWQCDVRSGEAHQLRASAVPVDAGSIRVTRASAPSADGTAIPMFLVHRADVTPTGDVPAMLYGYGGFNIAITPTFNAGRLVWVERGGVLAVANLRGGSEFGHEWYDAGRLAHKQNVFDDFAGCARWLASSGWSRPDRIAINGGSNGGLLVGAVLTQNPQLIGAAVPEVGVLDLLRYHRFTIGWGWTSDYGDPDDPEQYPWVRAYSPLHAIVPGTAYPPTLVMTGDHDDRVVPGHSFKFAATLQAAQAGPAPVLIRIETAAGHGAGMPVSKQIEARADMLAFVESALS
jgi:prolyl oligopeptidase